MSAHLKLLALSFLALTPIVTASSGVWWTILGMQSLGPNDNQVKETLNIVGPGLSEKQVKMIQNHKSPALISTIARGAKMAINECQRQFRHRRWNCSSNDPYNVFGSILRAACRETAFAYAITAAAVSHQISRACSEGELKTCRCDNRYQEGTVTKEGWQYGGCSDNIRFADKFAKKFLNLGEKYQDFRARVNIHNNEAGKAAVRNNMNLQCKCHGPSKSCTLNICWKKVPNFRKVGQILKEKFDGSSKVEIEQKNSGKKMKFTPVNKLHKPPTRADLIYYEESPNFCTKNSKVGSLGTKGRECNQTSMGTDGCDLLCCGRGYKSKWDTKNTPCNCNFVWCCRVDCDTCKKTTKAVRNNMNLECKCHGLSDTCTLKTCWRRVPNFRKVGQILKEKFDGASEVKMEHNNSGKKMKFTLVNKLHKRPTQADLIYYQGSPNFCTKNSKVGSLGTKGRECNQTSMGTDGCDLLCCGRGYESKWDTKNTPCNCKFVWCCKVNCDTCKETKNVHTCL